MSTSLLEFSPDDFTGQIQAVGNSPPLPLDQFCREAWPYIEPAKELVWSWHLDVICEHLEAVTRGDIIRLLINMPPRCSKSTIISVLWPAWVHTFFPSSAWLTGSYAMSMAMRDVDKHRQLVKTDWYQKNWGQTMSLSTSQDTKTQFRTTRGGMRLACSPDSAATAEGGHFVLGDDPMKAQDAFSPAKLRRANNWWGSTMATREILGYETRFILVMQRLSAKDPSNEVLERGGYVHLCLPMEYDSRLKSRLPPSEPNPLGWEDPRTKEGELLFPAVHPFRSLASKKRYPHMYASQYQQIPSPVEGLLFKTDNLRRYGALPEVKNRVVTIGHKTFTGVYLSLDSSFKSADESSYVALGVWGYLDGDYYLLEVIRERLGFFDTLQRLSGLYAKYTIRGTYVEVASNGHAIIEAFKRAKISVHEVTVSDSKLSRAYAVQPVVQDRRLWLPDDTAADWVEPYVLELAGFPHSSDDDQVDMTTQILNELESKTQALRAYQAFTQGVYQ